MATTPAALAPEAIAAHSTDYAPLLALDRIHVHPHNPRHQAIADDELIKSIRDQGLIHDLVVAPHPKHENDYILIDGHRRLDGLTKAGYSYAPAKIRLDLLDEADQIAAMLATIRREDLTPIEEAEGFDLLTEMGWTVEQIAAATGRSASTVKSRRKLTALAPSFQEQVSAGQVTLDDALLMASLPDKEQQRIAKLKPTEVHYELGRSQDRVRRERDVAKEIKGLQQLGGTEQKMPKGGYYWGLNDAQHGLTIFSNLPGFLREAASHKGGCLGWVNDGTAQYPSVKPVCTDVARHDAEIATHQAEVLAARSEEERARDAENAARAAEQEAQREVRAAAAESRRVAARMRADVVLEAIRKVKIPAVLAPVLRSALVDFFLDWPLDEQLFQDLADVPEDLRWTSWNGVQPYLDSVPAMTPTQLWRAFTAALVAHIEQAADYAVSDGVEQEREASILGEYLDALVTAGHQLTPPDEDLAHVIAGATADEQEQAS